MHCLYDIRSLAGYNNSATFGPMYLWYNNFKNVISVLCPIAPTVSVRMVISIEPTPCPLDFHIVWDFQDYGLKSSKGYRKVSNVGSLLVLTINLV